MTLKPGAYLYVCPLCQGETHERDPWENHTADCPNKPTREEVMGYLDALTNEATIERKRRRRREL